MFITGVNDTGEKLFSGVNDTGEKFIGGVVEVEGDKSAISPAAEVGHGRR